MIKTEEIVALEERWKEYKSKIIFRKIVVVFLALLFIASFVLLFLVLEDSLSSKNEANITHNATNQTLVLSDPTNATIIQNESSAEANSSLGANESAIPQAIESTTPNATIPPISNTSNLSSSDNTTATAPKKIAENGTNATKQLPKTRELIAPPVDKKIIIETNDIQNIEELIKKFEASNNIVFATMISEEYFDRKNYRKSLEWALKANEIDSQNELSWIMFAKSQVKLGKRDDAIRALEIYTDYAKSASKASNLLKSIRSGEYK
ncbi:MAG: hypothetical protein LBQ18_08220 [Campylobacteraceae bacterium]|jgi:tetratricopeptide (TPR) repeat protein|nr:hypothetical protein [Campylobacteraceae bacterium]